MTPNKFFRHYLPLLPLLLLAVASPPHALAQPDLNAVNLSTRMRVQTGDRAAFGGFMIRGVTAGTTKRVLIRAIGPSLSHNGIADFLADPRLDCPTCSVIFNNNWKDDPMQRDLIEATLIPPTNDLEAAIVADLSNGDYTAMVTGAGTTSGVALIEVYDLDRANGKLANLSTRAFVSTGDNVVIAGLLLRGDGALDTIVVRGLGPSVGVSPVLADPTLELRDNNGTLLISNNDWADDPGQMSQIILANLAPAPLESALIIALPPGLYTALLAGLNFTTGIGLIEIYDL